MAICSCNSWSERPSSCSIVCWEEEKAEEEEVEGVRMDTPKKGKPVVGFWRGHKRFGVDTLLPVSTM